MDPIEEFDTWAWGEHPNGLGYKARDERGFKMFIIFLVFCVLFKVIFWCRNGHPLELCLKYPELGTTAAYCCGILI